MLYLYNMLFPLSPIIELTTSVLLSEQVTPGEEEERRYPKST